MGVRCDVARLEDVEALRDAALAEFGAVHVVFNNAGVGGGPTIGSPIEMWRWVRRSTSTAWSMGSTPSSRCSWTKTRGTS